MGLLERYKKNGGFVQLLNLLETCGQAKREKFLSMILEENPTWHDALKQRILNMDRILAWPPEILAEVTSRSLPITLAAIAKGLSPEQSKHFFTGLSHSHISKIREVSENKAFSPPEINSSVDKFLGETRNHIQQGVIKLEKFAPDLAVPEKIEEMLDKMSLSMPPLPDPEILGTPATPRTAAPSKAAASAIPSVASNNDEAAVLLLRKQMAQMQQELQALKQENGVLKDKLERIKKIA